MIKKVVEVKEVQALKKGQLPWYRLKLECGHTVYRKKVPLNGPPTQAVCTFCSIRRVQKLDSE